MARKVNEINQDKFRRQEQKRKTNNRSIRKYYLIVCEGTKTEPNYFEGLKNDLPKGVLTSFQIDIKGTGRNTQSLIDEAVRIMEDYQKETGRPVDKLWTVFDRDSFTADSFNSAILRCQTSKPEIGCAWSNEAFELWYLLHFNYYNTAMERGSYQKMIEENLQPKIGKAYRYQKNSKEMYQILKQHGDQQMAIRNAERLAENFAGRQDYANHNPCTMVHELVKELFTLK